MLKTLLISIYIILMFTNDVFSKSPENELRNIQKLPKTFKDGLKPFYSLKGHVDKK